jgi:hypothetical protein
VRDARWIHETELHSGRGAREKFRHARCRELRSTFDVALPAGTVPRGAVRTQIEDAWLLAHRRSIFRPLTINGVTFKNRVVCPAWEAALTTTTIDVRGVMAWDRRFARAASQPSSPPTGIRTTA